MQVDRFLFCCLLIFHSSFEKKSAFLNAEKTGECCYQVTYFHQDYFCSRITAAGGAEFNQQWSFQ
jgi:hypothetical protein